MPAVTMKRGNTDLLAHRGGGGITKRRNIKTDRDGDLVMDGNPRGRDRAGRGRGRGNNSTTGHSAGRGSINSTAFQQQILRHVASGDVVSRTAKPGPSSRHLKELKITGWTSSKAATNDDGGVASLIAFLEKRATIHKSRQAAGRGDKANPATVKKSRVDGEALIISVPSDEMSSFLRVDGYMFAGTNIKIEQSSSSGQSSTSEPSTSNESTNEAKQLFQNFLSRRYNAESKLLDLSALGQDPELNAAGMFNSASTQSKFFPALMKICDTFFTSAEQKRDTVQSVTLAGNDLANLTAVTTLAQTFPDLLNLDLSNNKFDSLSSLIAWKHKFRSLTMLILSSNPIEQREPDFREKIKGWYPTLRFLDGVEIRSEEEAARSRRGGKRGLPTQRPVFKDEASIAETFIQNFFAGFDSNRDALIEMYYNNQSTFSYSLNNHALRDPSQEQKTQPHEWDAYIKQSRNLKHVTHLPARVNRKFKGPEAIKKIFTSLPATRHVAYATDPHKWCIECQPVAGVPDPSGQSPSGVGGFLITIHGEFEEVNSTGPANKQRSFDRTFIIGPGPDKPTGVAVVSDILVMRAYGGFAAWQPEEAAPVQVYVQAQAQVQASVQAQAPAPSPSPSPAQAQTQALISAPASVPVSVVAPIPANMSDQEKVVTVARMTGMTTEFSEQALKENGGDVQQALSAFEVAKAQGLLPAHAFA